jgi:methionine sulfoxide reductase heme-binding subunit
VQERRVNKSIWLAARIAVFILSLAPFIWLLSGAALNLLGPDPAKTLSTESGRWALRFLLLTLAVTPLRDLTGWSRVSQLRRMLGLYSWFYAGLHLLVYLMFLLQWRWSEIVSDVLERPYITVGLGAFIILTALGVTSNRSMMRNLGGRWKKLHRLVYLAALLALLHLIWILRTDLFDAIFYGSITVLLLGYRLVRFLVRRNRAESSIRE